jgi:type II secretory pathway pseudopilin PulG
MGIASVRRWHWVIIALIIGFSGAAIRRWAGDEIESRVDAFGDLLANQAQFESALVTEQQGERLFKDVTVYPYRVRDSHGGKRLVHIVSGSYWDGRARERGGQVVAVWQPTCFVAATPYKPRIPVAGHGDELFASQQFSSVLDYLATMREQAGVQFRYAWWWWMTDSAFLWPALSLVCIGGVWPTVVNLLVFGSLRRPAEAKGISLWHVRSGKKRAAAVAAPSYASFSSRQEGESERLDAPPVPVETAEASPPVKALSSQQLDPVAAALPRADKDYGAEKDDFYPTELHPHHAEHGQTQTAHAGNGAVSRGNGRGAFSLVELIVVIGVIALLIAMLLPAVTQVPTRANRLKCMNNLRQLLIAQNMYVTDSGGYLTYPNWAVDRQVTTNWPTGWLYAQGKTHEPPQPDDVKTGILFDYLGKIDVFRCPAHVLDDSLVGTDRMTSYIMNGAVCGYGTVGSQNAEPVVWVPSYKLTDWRRASEDIMMWEAEEVENGGNPWNDGASYPWENVLSKRHGRGASVGCFDFHVEWMDRIDFITEYQRPGPNRLYCDPHREDGGRG